MTLEKSGAGLSTRGMAIERRTEEDTSPGTLVSTLQEVRDTLNTLGDMSTSTEWERAAYVWAICTPLPGTRTDLDGTLGGKLPFTNLAKWNCKGLTARQTVGNYWHYYDDAINEGKAEPVELGGAYRQPRKEWPGFPHDKPARSKTPAVLPAVVPVKIVAVEPGTPRWRELVRMGIYPVTDWEPGDAAVEVFPPSYTDVAVLNARCARNMEQYSRETGRSLSELGQRWEVSVRWPVGTRVDECSWDAHRELRKNPDLLKPGMTAEDAREAAHRETGRLIYKATVALSDGFEIQWDEDRPMPGGRATAYRVYQLDVLRGVAGRHQALTEGGKDGYFAYIAEHPLPFDMWSAEYGDPAPASDKHQREREASWDFRLAWEASGKTWAD